MKTNLFETDKILNVLKHVDAVLHIEGEFVALLGFGVVIEL